MKLESKTPIIKPTHELTRDEKIARFLDMLEESTEEMRRLKKIGDRSGLFYHVKKIEGIAKNLSEEFRPLN